MQFPKKIPMVAGILLLVLLVGGMVAGGERLFRQPTVASGSIAPTNVTITNVTDSSFTVTWTTQLPATGAVEVQGVNDKKRVAFDERDTNARSLKKYTTHSITVRNLTPDAQYATTILSAGKARLTDGKPYQVNTAPTAAPVTSPLEPAYGMVTTAADAPADGALIYLTLEGSQTLSAVVKPSGTWMIPLNLVRTLDLSRYLPVTERMTENITVVFNGDLTSAVGDTLNDAPVPTMVIGKTYDFRKVQADTSATGGAPLANTFSQTPAILGSQTAVQPDTHTVTLAAPAEGASLPTTLPLIQGTGIPGKTVTVTVGITNPTTGITTVGTDGVWRYTPPSSLSAGKQSVTVTTKDAEGKPVAITHTFEILKSGTQVLGVATPSATLAPTPQFTPTPTSTLAGQPVPVSGTVTPTLILLLIGLLLLSGGVAAFAL
ncbi:fibronectin type III domain-containing protein [Candidatus Gottesmanbacteria bacterium]|nr:fibronectin type III domain-containing protein [Candidatus Gottesmanbacteria bacterium]